MERFDKEIGLLRCFHYAVGLPVCLTHEGKKIFSVPENITNAAAVGEAPPLSELVYDSENAVQYLRTEAAENYILLMTDESTLVTVGPFLVERPPQSFITDMARAGKIKLHSKNAMQSYYDSLPVISSQCFFYSGRLLEQLFSAEKSSAAQEAEVGEAAAFIQPEYYLQTRDYRLRQFRHSPYAVEQEICHAISSGDIQGARRILREINSRPRARLAGTALRSLKNSVICSCCFMTRAAISGGVSPDGAFTLSDTYIQRIESCADIKELLSFEDEMLTGFTAEVNAVKKGRFSGAVTQAIAYIDARLCEPITVRQVAEAVFLSPNYLSGLFTRETGETVHGFIVRRRISEAAYFVKNTADPIADIASFYQFSSQSHFVQSFKRIMGTTPGAYRRSIMTESMDRQAAVTGRS